MMAGSRCRRRWGTTARNFLLFHGLGRGTRHFDAARPSLRRPTLRRLAWDVWEHGMAVESDRIRNILVDRLESLERAGVMQLPRIVAPLPALATISVNTVAVKA